MTRRQKPRTVDLPFEADIVGRASARDVSDNVDTAITNEPASPDDESATASGKASDVDPLAIAIQLKAYELYLSRGESHGDELADWLEAERIVRRLMS